MPGTMQHVLWATALLVVLSDLEEKYGAQIDRDTLWMAAQHGDRNMTPADFRLCLEAMLATEQVTRIERDGHTFLALTDVGRRATQETKHALEEEEDRTPLA